MKFNVVSLFPDMVSNALKVGVVGQALERGVWELETINPRVFTSDVHKTVDDRPYGGGDGMVMLAEPLAKAVESLKDPGRVVYLSPHGKPWSDSRAQQWAREGATTTLICGRYGGVDQRFIEESVDEEISLGDFVLSGGEAAAIAIIDSTVRLLPLVLGNSESPLNESFRSGTLEAPQYTRPREYGGMAVPDVLLSGHHQNIKQWRTIVSYLRTKRLRPDMVEQSLSEAAVAALEESAAKILAKMSSGEKRACGLEEVDCG